MSISVIDYTGDYINKDILPNEPIQLVICEECSLVPDKLNAVLLVTLDYEKLTTPGIYIFRIPNDLYRGITYGHIYTFCNSAKFYTSRYEMLSLCVPAANLFDWQMPYKLITYRAGKIEKFTRSLKENFLFDQIYLESLNKFSKMYLINKYTRVNKTRSLKSQLKNLVEGIMVSNTKQGGGFIEFSADNVVEVIVNDLESYGVIMCGVNIQYNEQVIEEYFGEFKSKVFVPSHKLPSCEGQKPSKKPLSVKLKPSSGCVEASASASVGCLINLGSAEDVKKLDQNFTHKSVPASTAKALDPTKRPAQSVTLYPAGGAAESKAPSQYYPVISKPVPFITSNNNKLWEQHEALVLSRASDSILENLQQVDNILKLYRICNRIVRDYVTGASLSFEDPFIAEIVRRTTETLADKYFVTDSSLPFTDLFKKLENNVSVKLYQKLN